MRAAAFMPRSLSGSLSAGWSNGFGEAEMADELLSEIRVERTALSVASFDDADDDVAYWWSRTPEERLAHVEVLRRINYGDQTTGRLKWILEVALVPWR